MRILKHIFPLFLLIFLLYACKKEFKQASWDADLLLPLFKSTLRINDLLADSLIQENPDKSLKIVFENDLYSLDSIYRIPDTSLIFHYGLPFGTFTFQPGQVIMNRTDYTKYKLGDVELGTMHVKSGFMQFVVRSEIAEITNFTYKLIGSTKNGQPVEIKAQVPAKTANGPGLYTGVYDLSGVILDLKGPTGNRVNTLSSSTILQVNPNGQPVMIYAGDSLSIINSFIDIVPDYAQGYFGSSTFSTGSSASPFSLFSKIKGGSLKLEDFQLNLSLENEIGVDLRATIEQFASKNSRTATVIHLNNPLVGSPINLNRATETGNPAAPVKAYRKSFLLNGSNSNIKALIEHLPDTFLYAIKMTVNPLGNISGSKDFVYHNRNLKTKLNIEFPLSLFASNLILADTSYIDLNTVNKNKVRDGVLTLHVQNGFPLDAQLQIYTLDADDKKTDSLLIEGKNTIRSAALNAQLRVESPNLSKLSIPLNKTKLDRLFSSGKLLVLTRFSTAAPPQLIKLYSDYSIDFKLTANFNYLLEL